MIGIIYYIAGIIFLIMLIGSALGTASGIVWLIISAVRRDKKGCSLARNIIICCAPAALALLGFVYLRLRTISI